MFIHLIMVYLYKTSIPVARLNIEYIIPWIITYIPRRVKKSSTITLYPMSDQTAPTKDTIFFFIMYIL
jgi:hypothetical protein